MTERILDRCTGRLALVAVLVFVVGGAALFTLGPFARLKSQLDGAPFPEEAISSAARLETFLGDLDAAQRSLYLQVQAWDVVHPILIGFLGVALVGWLMGHGPRMPFRSRLLILPLVAPVADLAENVVITAGLLAHPESSRLAAALPVLSGIKFAGLGLTVLTVALLVVLIVGRAVAARRIAGRPAGPNADSRRGPR